MDDRSSSGEDPLPADRSSWPVRLVQLGDEPADDLVGRTTAEERLRMVWRLTLDSWKLADLSIPGYPRHETPVRLVSRKASERDDR